MTFEQKHITSFDGTKIGYQVTGSGKTPFVLCNGLGGSMVAWSSIYHRFAKDFRFIAWDYRGLYTSEIPENLATLAIPYHVLDLEVILKKEKIKHALVGGWSMGTQVALEFYRRRADFFRGIFLINGGYGYPLKMAFNSPLARYIVPVLTAIIKRVMPHVQPTLSPVAQHVVSTDEFISIVVGLGMIHHKFNTEIFRKIAQDLVMTDLGIYHEVMDQLCLHDAEDVLPTIRVPTLIISGTRDILTPSSAAKTMAERIPGAELLILNDASHYSLLEFPDIINKRLGKFIAKHGFLKPAVRGKKRRVLKSRKRVSQETLEILSDPVAMRQVRQGIKDVARGHVSTMKQIKRKFRP